MNGVKLEELGVTYTNGPSSSLLSVSNPFFQVTLQCPVHCERSGQHDYKKDYILILNSLIWLVLANGMVGNVDSWEAFA